jgi:hypothetical protein
VTNPDVQTLRNEALTAGAMDPMNLRFRIVECDRFDGALLSVAVEDIGFEEAIEHTAGLARTRADSHFYLEPVGFIQ